MRRVPQRHTRHARRPRRTTTAQRQLRHVPRRHEQAHDRLCGAATSATRDPAALRSPTRTTLACGDARLSRQGREPRRHADLGGGLHHLSHVALCDRRHVHQVPHRSQSFHHATTTARPLSDCAGCHNGTIAATPPTTRATAHPVPLSHRDEQAAERLPACHDKAQGGVPAVVYTNDLTCGDARCHSMVPSHSGTPIRRRLHDLSHGALRGSRHLRHCHADSRSFHHGTAGRLRCGLPRRHYRLGQSITRMDRRLSHGCAATVPELSRLHRPSAT